ncbi:uncharacterized protein BDZ83DRAFT_201158 [Colletotrichum acutatum]|uniref:Uncharacterized protein n=1 Tax=Glomerella acutata TaxID=27357 RepID=A0AAD8XBC5_GLOAC|nr:uncharacterized protein BDZ83DRAFT_201158 [Colletotrichum acutatum]KAK1705951.1 hypothetical protein BDZ83DRAFT_201158 [Colletotrichum acutatum]
MDVGRYELTRGDTGTSNPCSSGNPTFALAPISTTSPRSGPFAAISNLFTLDISSPFPPHSKNEIEQTTTSPSLQSRPSNNRV